MLWIFRLVLVSLVIPRLTSVSMRIMRPLLQLLVGHFRLRRDVGIAMSFHRLCNVMMAGRLHMGNRRIVLA